MHVRDRNTDRELLDVQRMGHQVSARNETVNRSAMRAASAVLVAITLAAGAVTAGADQIETVNVPAFGQVTVYLPEGSPQNVVLFLSGDGGWNLGVVGMAERLRREGALVVGIDIRAFMRTLESSTRCAYPAGALEELSRAVQ